MGQDNEPSDISFNLRFKSKELEREAKRTEKEIIKEKSKISNALKKGQLENARTFGENVIRKKSEVQNFYKMSARLDTVSSRLKSAQKQKEMGKSMGAVTRGLSDCLQTLNPDVISKTLDKFEKQCQDLDIITKVSDDSMKSATSSLVNENNVDQLLSEVMDENNIQLSEELTGSVFSDPSKVKKKKEDENDLAKRLENIKTNNN